MNSVLVAILAFVALIGSIIATPLDDYVWKKDDAYGWVDMVRMKANFLLFKIESCSPGIRVHIQRKEW